MRSSARASTRTSSCCPLPTLRGRAGAGTLATARTGPMGGTGTLVATARTFASRQACGRRTCLTSRTICKLRRSAPVFKVPQSTGITLPEKLSQKGNPRVSLHHPETACLRGGRTLPGCHESEWAHGFGSPRTSTQSAARIGIPGSQPAHAAGGSGKAGHDAQLASSPLHRAAQPRSQPAAHRHRAELRTVAARSRRRRSQIHGRSRGQWRWRHKYPNVEQWHSRVRKPGSLSPLRLVLGASR